MCGWVSGAGTATNTVQAFGQMLFLLTNLCLCFLFILFIIYHQNMWIHFRGWRSHRPCQPIVNHIRESLCLQHCFPNDVTPDVGFNSLGKTGREGARICLMSRKRWLVPPCHCADERLAPQKSDTVSKRKNKAFEDRSVGKARYHRCLKSLWTTVVLNASTSPTSSILSAMTLTPPAHQLTKAD